MKNQNYKETLENLIENSDLKLSQKELWHNFMMNVKDRDLKYFVEILEENSEYLIFFTENLEKKTEAFKKNDKKALKEILKEELDFIDKIKEK